MAKHYKMKAEIIKPYHYLMLVDRVNGMACVHVEFGDYSLSVVKQQARDIAHCYPKGALRIVSCNEATPLQEVRDFCSAMVRDEDATKAINAALKAMGGA